MIEVVTVSATYLVTGAAGFIGSHLVELLIASGERVLGLDNFDDYYAPARKRANLQDVRSAIGPEAAFEFVECDIRNVEALTRLVGERDVTHIVHLAAMPGVRNSTEHPHLYLDVNTVGTLNLLEAAKAHGVTNFVFGSTSSAYGATQQIPFVESDPSDLPLAPYPASKRSAELMGHAYHHLYGLNFTACRLFTVYGPRIRPDLMAHRVLDNMFRGAVVQIYNEGKMSRDWTYVADIANGLMLAAQKPLGYEVVNLGRGEPVGLNDFIAQLEAATGRTADLVPAEMPASDMLATYATIDKARRLLGYNPTTSVHEGVEALCKWYRSELQR